MRGLFIKVHSSFQFSSDPLIYIYYKYILLVNWNSILGNTSTTSETWVINQQISIEEIIFLSIKKTKKNEKYKNYKFGFKNFFMG